jgi:hypothetical protein
MKIANGTAFGFMKNFISYINKNVRRAVQECPYKALKVINFTLSLHQEEVRSFIDRVQFFPNGYYELIVTLRKSEMLSSTFDCRRT